MIPSLIATARQALQSGRPTEAVDAAQAVLAREPGHVDALEVLALVAQSRGDRAEAERHFRAIIAAAPEARWARDDLARLLLADGRADAAEAVIRAALAADGDHADAHALLGAILSERERLVEGAWHLRRALALAGFHADLAINLARNLMRQGALEEAAALAEQAAAAVPNQLAPAILQAEIGEKSGNLAEASRRLDHAERLAGREGRDVTLARATLLSHSVDWPQALAMLDGTPTLSGAARLLRGRLREKAGRFDEAWNDFVTGKAALAARSGATYDAAAVKSEFAALAGFPATLPVAAKRTDVAQPLFILGLPRSGTTMAEQVLASHSRIRAGGELPFVAELRDFAARLLGDPFPATLSALAAADHHHLPALFRDFYLARAEVYGLTGEGADYFTDKMPLNEVWLPLLRLAFPQSPIIAVRRHPLDTLVSIMAHDMTHGGHAGYRIEDAAHHLAAVATLSETYRTRLGLAPHVFAYEAFVADPAAETARLMAAIGLAPEPAQAAFHLSPRHAPTPSYAQVREPVHQRSVNRWRPYAAHLAPILPVVAEALAQGGYSAG